MIALITPTGERFNQIKSCVSFMKRQTYKGDILWVIVDDGEKSSISFLDLPINSFPKNWKIVTVFPNPKWRLGQNTQSRNLQEGINVVKQYSEVTNIYIIEDDDFYFPNYLEVMEEKMQGVLAASEIHTIYYNVKTMNFIYNRNSKHGSLFQTAFKPSLIPIFEKVLEEHPKFIDMHFWNLIQTMRINLFKAEKVLSVGIKGLSGRPGIGSGHIQKYVDIPTGDKRAEKLKLLKSLIGMDYLLYL